MPWALPMKSVSLVATVQSAPFQLLLEVDGAVLCSFRITGVAWLNTLARKQRAPTSEV